MNTLKFILKVVLVCGMGLFACLISGCKKKMTTQSINDLSVASDIRINRMIKLGDKVILVGGAKYKKAAMYSYHESHISTISIPENSTQKEINGLAISPNGIMTAVAFESGIYHSSNQGHDWTFNQNPSWSEFMDLAFISADSAVVVGKKSTNIGFITFMDAQGNGSNIPFVEKNFELDDVDETEGVLYCCGYGAVLKSTNFGHTWDFTSAKNDFFKAMYWHNQQSGMVVGYEGSILKTEDGGHNWQAIRKANHSFVKRIHFLDIDGFQQTRVAVGEKGLVWISRDEGEHWKTIDMPTLEDLRAVILLDENNILVGGTQGAVYEIKL